LNHPAIPIDKSFAAVQAMENIPIAQAQHIMHKKVDNQQKVFAA
jgi:hypothetical protein